MNAPAADLSALPARMLRLQRHVARRARRETAKALRPLTRARRRAARIDVHTPSVDPSMTRAELYREAQAREIAGRSTMNKSELISALRS